MASLHGKVDRQTTTPFLLKLFYKEGAFTPLSDFHSSSSSSLPPHITLYTWQTCTLRELAHLISHSHPELLPAPSIGTRLAFRLVFPDTRSASASASATGAPSSLLSPSTTTTAAAGPGRFLHQDLGSVVLGDGGPGVLPVDVVAEEEEGGERGGGGGGGAGGKSQPAGAGGRRAAGTEVVGGGEGGRGGGGGVERADVMLQDVRFVIGDYIAVAILPPLGNGSVAPAPGPALSGPGMAGGMARGGGRAVDGRRSGPQLAFGGGVAKMGGARENGFGSGGFRGRGRGGGGWGGGPGLGLGGPRGAALPSGEWRRGERLPDGPPGFGGRGGYGGGRGRDRW